MRRVASTAQSTRRAWLTLAAVAMALWAPAQAARAQGLKLPEIQTWELQNGMKVAFMRIDTAPVVAAEVWYHAGSKDEPRDRRGSAHMFEHMMFKGTAHVPPEEHARHVNRLGGYVNASTSEDATWYINIVPVDYLDFVLQLEAERMRNLLFRQEMIRTEREVVKEEIRQQENNPLAKGFLRFRELAYSKHPYAWTAGGYIADLDATSAQDLKRFYDTYYVPNNAMLVVVGALTREQVEAAAQKWFAAIPRGAEPPRPADSAMEPPQTQMRREAVAPGQLGLILAGYHVPAAKHDDIYALQIAALILGGGDASRLHQRLVRQDKLAVQAGAQPLLFEHPGQFALVAAYLDPAKTDTLEAALLDEAQKLTRVLPTAAELRKAKNQLQSALVFSLENVVGIAEQIGQSWILTGNPGDWLTSLERYEAVTAADIRRVVTTYFTKQNLTVVVVPPAGAAAN